jgi:hypothetical protein
MLTNIYHCREIFARAKEQSREQSAEEELPTVTLSHVSPAVLLFMLPYFYTTKLALPSFNDAQGRQVIFELYRSMGLETIDVGAHPEPHEQNSGNFLFFYSFLFPYNNIFVLFGLKKQW